MAEHGERGHDIGNRTLDSNFATVGGFRRRRSEVNRRLLIRTFGHRRRRVHAFTVPFAG